MVGRLGGGGRGQRNEKGGTESNFLDTFRTFPSYLEGQVQSTLENLALLLDVMRTE